MKPSRILIVLWVVAAALALQSGLFPGAHAAIMTSMFDPSHRPFEKLLKRYVKDGLVDYRGLKSDPAYLNDYLRQLANVSTGEYDSWPRNEKLAYWINAYNAFTLKVIVDRYPIKRNILIGLLQPADSIKQIPGAWDSMRFQGVGGAKTLESIERDVLRREFHEPRIYFAIVPAALGGPPLRSEPYTASRLTAQLEDQTTTFFRNSKKARLDSQNNILYLNPILDWFGPEFGDRIVFASHYLKLQDADVISRYPVSIRYLPYDWTLNERH